ncbi:MAG: ABC transporter permease [Spirochaetales bacterium]|nr:ABC transporter permease [Spirochaetales bacterium]
MKQLNWILFTAFRYLRTRSRNRKLGPSVLAVAGISIGVMALVSVLGVMNGFQLGFIEDIININSFHIRVYSDQIEIKNEILDTLIKTDGVKSVLPFIDIQTLVKGEFSDYEAVNVRAVPGNIRDYDPVMADQLNIIDGELEIKGNNSILLGQQLAARLGVGVNGNISLVSMEGSNFRTLTPSDRVFSVSGIFKSGYYNFDRSMGFTLISNSGMLASGKENLIYGIKLIDQYKDRAISSAIKEKLGDNYDVVSWRDFNSSFFGALRTEKTAMMLVIGLIFIVVGVNIKHSLERSVVERKEEIGILMSLGATSSSIRTIFIIEGLIIGMSGGFLGLIFGFLITSNINSIFRVVEIVMEMIVVFFGFIISPFATSNLEAVSMFSAANFYITEVPVRIIYSEIVFVFLFAVLSSTWAAYSASKKVSLYRPSEVLRYE